MAFARSFLFLVMVVVAESIFANAKKPRAIVLMLADDFGYNNVGFSHGPAPGNPEVRTPTLDSLARDGVVLDRMYTYKYCSPTRSSLMTGRVPPRVNQNNLNNDIQAKSGPDLRMTLLPEKMRKAGYYTAMVGKSHLGARSPANLPANRGFDYHFGFLKGGEDHYTQASASKHGIPATVDLWEGQGISNETGVYSGYLYAQRAVDVIRNASETGQDLFLYLAWHNTHTPNECPEEWRYPSRPSFNDSNPERMTYNCMARILDDGVKNVTDALREAGMWEDSLLWFAADNGGWLTWPGANNYPLRGGKVSDFEGGIRAVSFLAGGFLPMGVRGGTHQGYVSVADWYGTLAKMVGVDSTDDVPGLPPVESNDFWPSIMVPNATESGRDELFLSWSCDGQDDPTGLCHKFTQAGGSIYNTSEDPTAGQGLNDKGYIWQKWKIVVGRQNGLGIWQGPVFPNATKPVLNDQSCVNGCLFDIWSDPTEHHNMRDERPEIWRMMVEKLLAAARTTYQTDYGEPGVTCVSGEEAAKMYVGHNTCPKNRPGYNPSGPQCDESKPRVYLGPMCFRQ
eukprot:g5247.t1